MEININNNTNFNRKNFLSQDQLNILKESFDLFDSQNNLEIDLYELKLTLKAFNFKLTKEKFQALITKHNCFNNIIKYNDYLELMTNLMIERNPREEASLAFDSFDEEKKGKIGIRELKKAVKELNTNIEDDDLKSIINEFDGDSDGFITKDDFLKILDEYYFN